MKKILAILTLLLALGSATLVSAATYSVSGPYYSYPDILFNEQ